jgi:hypothetical protein
MLLHVILPAENVDLSSDVTSRSQVFCRSFEVMHNPSVFAVGDLSNALFRCSRTDPTGVVDLPSASRIERSAVESDCRPRAFSDLADLAFKLVEEGVVIVEPVGHASFILFEPAP